MPSPPPYSEKDPVDAPRSSAERASLSRTGAKNSQKATKASSGLDATTAKRKVPALKLRSVQTLPSPVSAPASTLSSHADGALDAVDAPSEGPAAPGAIKTSDGVMNPPPRTPAHRQSAERREEQVKKRKEAQRIDNEGNSTGEDLIGLWHICRKKLQLKAEEIKVTENLLHELCGADLSAMSAEGLIELIGFMSRTISPGDYRHFRAVLSQLDKRGEDLLAARISPLFFMLLNGIGQFDVSKTDEQNAVSMAREITLMSTYLNQPYGLTRAYERALQVMEAESVSPVHVQTENAERQASSPASTKKSGRTLRRSMANLFAPKGEAAQSAEDAPKSPRSEGKNNKSDSASRRSFNFSSPHSTAASLSPREKDATDEYTLRVGPLSVSPRARAGTVTPTMLQHSAKKWSSTISTPTTTTTTSPSTSTATKSSTTSPRRASPQSATMSPRRKPLPALFEDRGSPPPPLSPSSSLSPRTTAAGELRNSGVEAVAFPMLAVQSPAWERLVAGETPLANMLKLFRAQRSVFVETAGAQATPESAERQHGLLERFLVHLPPSVNHATQAVDVVYQALKDSGLTYEEMKTVEKSCWNCLGWFGGGDEALQLESILKLVPLYVGRFKAVS